MDKSNLNDLINRLNNQLLWSKVVLNSNYGRSIEEDININFNIRKRLKRVEKIKKIYND